MDGDNKKNGYEGDDDYGDQILQLCKLAQGNITTIYWCKQQIKKRLKVLDRLVDRMSDVTSLEPSKEKRQKRTHLDNVIKRQTDACKNLGEKIQEEIESLEQIRIAAKSFGIDIKTRLLELDDTLNGDDVNSFFDGDE
tara:strand:+ start:1194 stop:1607 length:414 start_codon:yes stop_codon:yes gene_type:complete